MSLLIFLHSNYLFKTIMQTFYIALRHMGIRMRKSKCLTARAVFLFMVGIYFYSL